MLKKRNNLLRVYALTSIVVSLIFSTSNEANASGDGKSLSVKTVIPATYLELPSGHADARYAFHSSLAAVIGKNGKWGFINLKGQVVIGFNYASVSDFNGGNVSFVQLAKTGKYGVINRTGKMIIPPTYDGYLPFQNGVASIFINKGGKQEASGFIDENGKIIAEPIYNSNDGFSDNGLAVVSLYSPTYDGLQDSSSTRVIDKNGKTVFTLDSIHSQYSPYKSLDFFVNGFATVTSKDGKEGLIDSTGSVVVKPIYDFVYDWNSSGVTVENNNLYGLVDYNDNVLIAPKYSDTTTLVNNTFAYQLPGGNGLYGLSDTNGKIILTPTYAGISEQKQGVYAVEKLSSDGVTGNWGYIDSLGNPITKFIYATASDFNKDDTAIVSYTTGDDFLYGMINKSGKLLIPVKYLRIDRLDSGLILAESVDMRYYLYDNNGKVLGVLPNYQQVGLYSEGLLSVKSMSKWGFIKISKK